MIKKHLFVLRFYIADEKLCAYEIVFGEKS